MLFGCSRQEQPRALGDTPYGRGCENDPHMTNAEIIAEVKVCTDAGLKATAFHCADNRATISIQCDPQ